MVLLINNVDQRSLINMNECLELLEDAIREEALGKAVNRNKSILHIPTPDPELWHNYVSIEGGIAKSHYVAIRIRSDMERSVKTSIGSKVSEKYAGSLGNFCGLVFLYSSLNGELLAILNDGHLQHMRVGATYGLGAKYSSRKDSRILCIIGSGGMAFTHALAYSLVRSIDLVRVYSPNREHREKFAARLREEFQNTKVEATDTPREALKGADMVSACTTSLDPVIKAEWLEDGMHLSEVTQFEIDSNALGRIDRYVHYRTGIPAHLVASSTFPKAPSGTMQGQDFALKVDGSKVVPLTEILIGKSFARTDNRQITMFFGEGTGVQFTAVAGRIYEAARKRGFGRELPSEWFLQDIRT